MIYGELDSAELAAELPLSMRVDRAHVVMLVEQKLISAEAAGGLLRCMDELEAAGYAPLLGRPAPRGLYLMYEGYLIEQLGPDIGGVLHSGRSRNDLKACVTSLRASPTGCWSSPSRRPGCRRCCCPGPGRTGRC